MFESIKRVARNGVRRLPGEGRALSSAYKQLGVLKRVATTKLRSRAEADAVDPERLYWIDPARVAFLTGSVSVDSDPQHVGPAFDPARARGAVRGGNWDRPERPLKDSSLARAIAERIASGVPWRATAYGAELERGGRDLDEHFARLDRVVEALRRADPRNPGAAFAAAADGDSLVTDVNIGRDGRYLANEAAPALLAAQALGFARVPVKVVVRHPQWMEFRQFMRSLAARGGASSRANHLYQNPIHPDLEDIPSSHACEDRFEAARDAVPRRGGDLLDIGANLGYFCHRFEDLGYSCYAVEHEPLITRAADKIRAAEGKRFTILTGDVFELSEQEPLRGRRFEVVLAFNIFHHFLKHERTYDKLVAWLNRLDADVMIFEPHRSREPQMSGAYKQLDERGFVDFILANSVLERAELIHRCSDGRPVYKLSR